MFVQFLAGLIVFLLGLVVGVIIGVAITPTTDEEEE